MNYESGLIAIWFGVSCYNFISMCGFEYKYVKHGGYLPIIGGIIFELLLIWSVYNLVEVIRSVAAKLG